MRRRSTNPVILIATIIAVAIGAWWTDDGAPVRRAPEVRAERAAEPAPSAPRRGERPERAPQQEQSTADDALSDAVPDAGERAELVKTLELIERGGPFPHKQDGSVFGNRERRLPQQPRGYYHEYTVRTPGASNRGARRVVRGDCGELYYTRDHYRSFIRL